jgi:beta-glucosidase
MLRKFLLTTFVLAATAVGAQPQPWLNAKLSPDRRAQLVLAQLTRDEKLELVRGYFAVPFGGKPRRAGSVGGAGYVPGIARLGFPALQESDAGMGVANPSGVRPGDEAITLPSGLATAATWNPGLAERGGAMIGHEAWEKGFNVLLAGGVNLVREPRNGRNFEYAGEDPLLAGSMVGATIRGIQRQHVMSTVKHYVLNDQETGRIVVSSNIAWPAARESDLLAFEFAIEQGHPGSVMCSYNLVNGVWTSQSPYLLTHVLRKDWHYPGFVMSDWGAVHDAAACANAGLDQESGAELDTKFFFEGDLRKALDTGKVPSARLDEMVKRILRSTFAAGLVENPPVLTPINAEADADVSQADAEQGLVLLKNQHVLPLKAKRILLVGSHADVGVLSGGGSSQVIPVGGVAVPGLGQKDWPGPIVYDPSSPLAAMRKRGAKVDFISGDSPSEAAALARNADVVVVFAHQWMAESIDAPNLSLPDHQDALVEAVAAANRKTVVVLETGGPVRMPWLDKVAGVVEAWYPGARGGEAIARVLFGEINPSGRLPVTFPRDESQLPRPTLLNPKTPGVSDGPSPSGTFERKFAVDYDVEGADVGYRWYERRKLQPLFPFGFGLSYTTFGYRGLTATVNDDQVTASFEVVNSGAKPGQATPQLYVSLPDGSPARLAGWDKVELQPGQSRRVTLHVDRRLLARFKADGTGWHVFAGRYRLSVGANSADRHLSTEVQLSSANLAP